MVVVQARGFAGIPSPGHRAGATANASCSASSATSKSLKTLISVAMMRPDSSRKMRSAAARGLVLSVTYAPAAIFAICSTFGWKSAIWRMSTQERFSTGIRAAVSIASSSLQSTM